MVEKLIFSHFENHRHFENMWKELPNFFKFLSSHIYAKCGEKENIQKYAF
jgi:hypothetical protein